MAALRRAGVEVTHVKYDQQRPDLSKFDSLVGSVMLQASKALYAQQAAQADGGRHAAASLSVAVDEVYGVEQATRDAAARSASANA